MKTFRLHSEIRVPGTPGDVFPFFSDAGNLERLTPGWLRFEVVTPQPIPMGEGTEIDYRLRLRGIPVRWRSRITVWEPPHRFVDQQVWGPYRLWEHAHCFREDGGETVVTDRVRYGVWGGGIANRLLVAGDLDRIFRYRREQLAAHFRNAAREIR